MNVLLERFQDAYSKKFVVVANLYPRLSDRLE